MSNLKIFILCHNRPDDARQAITSVLAQTDQDFTLTISDNSSNDEVERMVKEHFPEVGYVRRQPMLPVQGHFNRCIDDAQQSAYFCLFHDDDLLGTRYVEAMKRAAQAHPHAVALGCNAWTESAGVLQTRPFFAAPHAYEHIRNARDLAYRYFGRGQSGIAPFPGYVYQTKGVGATRMKTDGGKYADSTWLMTLGDRGEIVWLREPLMTYRLHGGNDGLKESRQDRLRVMAYLKENRQRWGSGLLQDFRCSFIYKPMLRSGSKATAVRKRIAATFLRRYRWSRYLRLDTYQSLLRRALVKWGPQT